jgi:catechol 2,3-dioxygenase-like lactoylglutathione lyase family enzyme
MITAIHHVGLRSPDPRRALAAFGDFVGGVTDAEGEGAWLRGPNFLVHAARGEGPPASAPVHAIGLAHVCIQARDPAAARERLESAGVAYIADPCSLGTGVHYAYARDNEHRLLELETAPWMVTEPSGWFAHVAFVTTDLTRLLDFYAALLETEVARRGRFNGNPRLDQIAGLSGVDVEAGWLRVHGFTLEFWRYHAPALPLGERQSGYLHLALEVADADAVAARALALGATPDDGADLPMLGAVRAVRDPDGNRLVFAALNAAHAHLSVAAQSAPGVVEQVQQAYGVWAASQAKAS